MWDIISKYTMYQPSTDDNCTLWPEGTWSECCALHDRRYENKRLTRYQADKLLFRCVNRKSNIKMAIVMFLGVRLFGWFFYNKSTDPIMKRKIEWTKLKH